MPHIAHHTTLSINENVHYGQVVPQHGVRYHQQDNHGPVMYCGAAVAQIVLDSIRNLNGSTAAPLLDQTLLYNSHQGFSAPDPRMNWFTAPDGLTTTLNAQTPASFAGNFTLWHLRSEEAISRKLCWAIQQGVAPMALVEYGTHWIVVVGFEASATPTSSTDTSYVINSFDVFNPWPPTPYNAAPPPPHTHAADNCGNGIVNGKKRGDQYETIFYTSPGGGKYWSSYYMTPVPRGTWGRECVAICDADPPADTDDAPPVLDTTLVTDLDVIKDRATGGLDSSGQSLRVPWRMGLDGAQVGEPLLVEREDLDPSRFYYIVPFHRGESDVPVLALVDAYASGGLAGTIASPDGTTHFGSAVSRDTVLQEIVGQEVPVGDSVVTLEAQDLYQHLVWRPCVESLSPYWPFYRFDVGGPESGIRVYFRIDGERFNELTPGFGM